MRTPAVFEIACCGYPPGLLLTSYRYIGSDLLSIVFLSRSTPDEPTLRNSNGREVSHLVTCRRWPSCNRAPLPVTSQAVRVA